MDRSAVNEVMDGIKRKVNWRRRTWRIVRDFWFLFVFVGLCSCIYRVAPEPTIMKKITIEGAFTRLLRIVKAWKVSHYVCNNILSTQIEGTRKHCTIYIVLQDIFSLLMIEYWILNAIDERSDIADLPSSAHDDLTTTSNSRSMILYLLQLLLDGSIDTIFSPFVLSGCSQGLCCNSINTMPEGDVSKTHKLRHRRQM